MKKPLFILLGLIIFGAVIYGVIRIIRTATTTGTKKGTGGTSFESSEGMWLDQKPTGVPSDAVLKSSLELRDVFNILTRDYGAAIARNVEKIYRLETAHFTSGQYLRTGSAGMLATAGSNYQYPYGWTSLKSWWDTNPLRKPIGTVRWKSKSGKIYHYIAFPGALGFLALAEILKIRNNNAGSWYSTQPAQQAEYEAKLANITTQYT